MTPETEDKEEEGPINDPGNEDPAMWATWRMMSMTRKTTSDFAVGPTSIPLIEPRLSCWPRKARICFSGPLRGAL